VFTGLRGKHTLRIIAVSLAFTIFFVGILDRYFFIHEVLTVHVCDCFVGGFEVGEGYKAVALR